MNPAAQLPSRTPQTAAITRSSRLSDRRPPRRPRIVWPSKLLRKPRLIVWRRTPPPTRRRIVLWRKPPQRPRLNEKQIPPPKPRRVVWLQRVSQRLRLGETPPSRPMRRRTVWLRRLPRSRPIGTLILRYLRRR